MHVNVNYQVDYLENDLKIYSKIYSKNRERSEVEIKRTETAEHMLKLNLKAMAKTYCWLILGLDAIDYHHMNCGKQVLNKLKFRFILKFQKALFNSILKKSSVVWLQRQRTI